MSNMRITMRDTSLHDIESPSPSRPAETTTGNTVSATRAVLVLVVVTTFVSVHLAVHQLSNSQLDFSDAAHDLIDPSHRSVRGETTCVHFPV